MADEQEPRNFDDLVDGIEEAWNALDAQIARYPDDVITGPTDAAGWTIKDHIAHLIAWEASVVGIIRDGKPQNTTMGVDRTLWEADDLDAINEQIRAETVNDSLARVMEARNSTHRDLLAALDATTMERLGQRWTDAVGDSADAPTILQKVIGNTIEHYPEHGEWIAAIAASARET